MDLETEAIPMDTDQLLEEKSHEIQEQLKTGATVIALDNPGQEINISEGNQSVFPHEDSQDNGSVKAHTPISLLSLLSLLSLPKEKKAFSSLSLLRTIFSG